MSLAELINRAEEGGVKLILSPSGKVKVAGDRVAVNLWKPFLAEYRAELLSFLGEKNVEQVRKEIDFDKVDTDLLGLDSPKYRLAIPEICGEYQGVPEAVSIERAIDVGSYNNRQVRNENATQRNGPIATNATLAKKKGKPSPIALEWLKDHKEVLRLAGWTASELYRRDKSKGLAWVAIWDKEDLGITVKDGGVIAFQFQGATNQTITQTARPIKQRSRRLKQYEK